MLYLQTKIIFKKYKNLKTCKIVKYEQESEKSSFRFSGFVLANELVQTIIIIMCILDLKNLKIDQETNLWLPECKSDYTHLLTDTYRLPVGLCTYIYTYTYIHILLLRFGGCSSVDWRLFIRGIHREKPI